MRLQGKTWQGVIVRVMIIDHTAENKGWWHPPDGKYGPHSFIQQQPP